MSAALTGTVHQPSEADCPKCRQVQCELYDIFMAGRNVPPIRSISNTRRASIRGRRHCIVHTGSRFSSRAAKQIAGRRGDRLTLNYKPGDIIQFETADVDALASATQDYLRQLLTTLDSALPRRDS